MSPLKSIGVGIALGGIIPKSYDRADIVRHLLDPSGYVNVPPSFVRIMQGRAGAAIFLTFLATHQGREEIFEQAPESIYISHSSEEIEKATGLSYQVQKKSRETLLGMGLVSEKRMGLSSMYFHVLTGRLLELIQLEQKNMLPKFTKAGTHMMKAEVN